MKQARYTHDMEETTQLDPSTLQNLLGNSNTSLIPESLVTTLTVSFIVLNVLGVLFFVFYVLSIIRKWKVQSAVLDIQKDLAEIKTALNKPVPSPDSSTPSSQPVTPAQSSNVLAQSNESFTKRPLS